MTIDHYDLTDEERIDAILNAIKPTYGLRTIAGALLEGGRDIEAISDDDLAQKLYNAINENGGITEETLREVIREAGYEWQLESMVVSSQVRYANERTEHGDDFAHIIKSKANALPDNIAAQVVRQAIDQVESNMGLEADDFDTLLRLYQTYAEYIGWQPTYDDRIELWDELLAYTQYRVVITDPDGEGFTYERWAQDSTTAHNDTLRQYRHHHDYEKTEGVESINTTPNRRFYPNTDPLDDTRERHTRPSHTALINTKAASRTGSPHGGLERGAAFFFIQISRPRPPILIHMEPHTELPPQPHRYPHHPDAVMRYGTRTHRPSNRWQLPPRFSNENHTTWATRFRARARGRTPPERAEYHLFHPRFHQIPITTPLSCGSNHRRTGEDTI